MTRMNAREVAQIILTDQRTAIEVDIQQLSEIYSTLCRERANPSLLATVIRNESVLAFIFPEVSDAKLFIRDGNGKVSRDDLAFLSSCEYFDIRRPVQNFMQFYGRELLSCWKWLILPIGSVIALLFTWANHDAFVSFFNGTLQVVSIFAAVFIVFASIQQARQGNDVSIFLSGKMIEYHRLDMHFMMLAAITLILSLLGTMLASAKPELKFSGTVESFSYQVNVPFALEATTVSIVICNLVMLFVSLPQYFLERGKERVFAELTFASLDERRAQSRPRQAD